MDSNIKLPRPLKAQLMIWSDINYHDMEVIDQMQSMPDLERTLCRVFGVDPPEPKRGVLLELYVEAVLFCRKQGFRKEQTAALLSIIKSIHEANTETPLDNKDQCVKYAEELLLFHSVRRPPFSINLFSFVEASCILKYINDHYLRHYKLYKYVFTTQMMLKRGQSQMSGCREPQTVRLDLKTLIQKQVKQEMKRESEQLEERLSLLLSH